VVFLGNYLLSILFLQIVRRLWGFAAAMQTKWIGN
jgi:hypothetical protein